jgi:hypothetical protein
MKHRHVASSPITNAEYQLFLDERASTGQFRYPDHWMTKQVNQGRAFVAGVRPSDAIDFCQWLTVREQSHWCYRIPFEGEAGGGWRRRGAEITCGGSVVYGFFWWQEEWLSNARPLPHLPVFKQALADILFKDFARAFERWHAASDKILKSSEEQVVQKLYRHGIPMSFASFAIMVGNEYGGVNPASTLSPRYDALLNTNSLWKVRGIEISRTY